MSRASVLLAGAVMLFAAAAVMGVPVSRQRAMTLQEQSSSVSTAATTMSAAEFNGGEHKWIMRAAISDLVKTLSPAELNLFRGVLNDPYKLEDLHFLFADLYGAELDTEAISQGFGTPCNDLTAAQAAAFVPSPAQANAWKVAAGRMLSAIAPGKDAEAKKLVAWISNGELAAIDKEVAAGSPKASTAAYASIGAVRQQIGEDLITQGEDPATAAFRNDLGKAGVNALDTLHAVLHQGRFLKMAAVNVDHFAPCNAVAYAIGHRAALDMAVSGDVHTALQYEAMALHFISDHFAAGHVRNPRALCNKVCGASLGSLFTKANHDEDNYFGLHLVNAKGDKWVGFGDTRVADNDMAAGRAILKVAIAAAYKEVLTAATTKNARPAVFDALSYAPHEDTTAVNHASLVKVGPKGELMYRQSPAGVFSRATTVTYEIVSNKLKCAMGPILKTRVDGEISKNKLDIAQGPADPKPASAQIVSFKYP